MRSRASFSSTSRERQGLDAVGVLPKSIHRRHWRRSCRQCLSALAGHCIDDDYAKELVIVVDTRGNHTRNKFKMAAGPSGKHSFDLQPERIQQVDKQLESQSSTAVGGPKERRPKRGDECRVPRMRGCSSVATTARFWQINPFVAGARPRRPIHHQRAVPWVRCPPQPDGYRNGLAEGAASRPPPHPASQTADDSEASLQSSMSPPLVGLGGLPASALPISHSGPPHRYTPPVPPPWSAPARAGAFVANAHPSCPAREDASLRVGYWTGPADPEGAASRPPSHPAGQIANDFQASLRLQPSPDLSTAHAGAAYQYMPPLAQPRAISIHAPVDTPARPQARILPCYVRCRLLPSWAQIPRAHLVVRYATGLWPKCTTTLTVTVSSLDSTFWLISVTYR
ncbi:hypothetical protein GGX14DRAFT_666633 [Mycena pura]|uniref:Uncharacterized protein n=1 Tax=Mycena pura TaxID=153505 RepID=A0AAD6Y5W6_9AGAR|nr:hypothetical protein GGX14DRAFT_666633 [Mycena pura]